MGPVCVHTSNLMGGSTLGMRAVRFAVAGEVGSALSASSLTRSHRRDVQEEFQLKVTPTPSQLVPFCTKDATFRFTVLVP